MPEGTIAVLVTLVTYKLVLLGIGFAVQRRNRDEADYFLGGRKLGALVAAISASASSSSAWTLLGVSGFAFAYGVSALWLIVSCFGGFLLNWCWVAPRLRRASGHALTLTEWLADTADGRHRRQIVTLASGIIVFCFLFYVASQFGGAGKTLEDTFELDRTRSILIGGSIVLVYTLLGGFWAVSITDTLQGLMMALTAVILPVAALVEVGGPAGLWEGMQQVDTAGYTDPFGEWQGAAAIGFTLGLLGIGLGYPGQPHVVNRFMALRDERSLRRARAYSLGWAAIVYVGMVTLGLCARLFLAREAVLDTGGNVDAELAFVAANHALFPPVLAGVILAAVLSAIMSTADSQLLVCASSVSHDLGLGGRNRLRAGRMVVAGVSACAIALALTVEQKIFDRVLFAWSALAAAFGPLVLIKLWRGPLDGRTTLAAMTLGFIAAVTASVLRQEDVLDTAWQERVLAFGIALAVAWAGRGGGGRRRPSP